MYSVQHQYEGGGDHEGLPAQFVHEEDENAYGGQVHRGDQDEAGREVGGMKGGEAAALCGAPEIKIG